MDELEVKPDERLRCCPFYVYAERGKEHHREDVDDAVLAEYAARLRLAGDGE